MEPAEWEVFARAQGSTSSQAAPQHAPWSHRHLGVVLLLLPRGPAPARPSLRSRPCPGAAPLRLPTGCVFNWAPTGISVAVGRLVWSPPLSSGRPPPSHLGPQPSARPQSPLRVGPCVFRGPPASRSAASPHPDWARLYLGSWAPSGITASRGDSSRVPRCFWAVRPHAASGRGPTQGRGFGRAPRPPALDLADGPIPPPGTLWGRHRGLITPGHFRQLRPSARTLISPEKARF
ncbi:hypothetical protein NDU88_003716 [Pleurodeles waltl]|uniref:Uncharacterized protein n=1 Tax=Pleurodeles waltl TaxID=8319 RepID=A0AAV7UEG9_PLEWA|nr:hypothetical protein NDU88_003716 [Pleurodeles waltl]